MTPAPAPIVAYLGGRGSFSEEASRRFLPGSAPMPLEDFASVARAVREGSADAGVLPIANSRVGPIADVGELLGHPELKVVGEEILDIRLHLCGSPQATVAQVDEVVSHPAALAQCERFLDGRDWRRVATPSTGEAARLVAANADASQACLASDAAATLHGLIILARNVQDDADNRTTFAIIERRDQFA